MEPLFKPFNKYLQTKIPNAITAADPEIGSGGGGLGENFGEISCLIYLYHKYIY